MKHLMSCRLGSCNEAFNELYRIGSLIHHQVRKKKLFYTVLSQSESVYRIKKII